MNIKFTPPALAQLQLVMDALTDETGFLTGQSMGKIRIIESIFPARFDEKSIDELYAGIYRKMGDQLMGVFFNRREPFESDWFIEDIIIKIKDPQPEFYFYDVDHRYIPLPDVVL
jgi:hypothetical protein